MAVGSAATTVMGVFDVIIARDVSWARFYQAQTTVAQIEVPMLLNGVRVHMGNIPIALVLIAIVIGIRRRNAEVMVVLGAAAGTLAFIANLWGDVVGFMEAIDPVTAKPKWRIPVRDYQIASAMLATGGGLVFSGKHTGEIFALDADTGEQLWEYRTSSGINAMPITWSHKGKQYVTVLSGLGGLYGTRSREALKHVPVGGSVWTFALPDF